MSVFRLIYLDYARYAARGKRLTVYLHEGFWTSVVYRISHSLLRQVRITPFKQILYLLLYLLRKVCEFVFGISLPAECEIGEGLYIVHYGPTVIHNNVKMGRNCSLSHMVTIGEAGRGDRKGCPTLGDRVYVAPGAIIIGKITIGDDAAIGAGAVVTKSVPPRAVVAGNPAKIISYRGSFDFIFYKGMEEDPDRITSMNTPPPDLLI